MRNKNAKVSDPNKFITSPGMDTKILYSSKILPTGEIVLTPCGKESMSERINAEKQFTDINYIMNRLRMGDTSVLKDGQAMYGDFTIAPKSLAESLQLIIDGERKFYQLPLEIRQKFNNSYNAWLMAAGTKEWSEIMFGYPDQEPNPDDLVIEKEIAE